MELEILYNIKGLYQMNISERTVIILSDNTNENILPADNSVTPESIPATQDNPAPQEKPMEEPVITSEAKKIEAVPIKPEKPARDHKALKKALSWIVEKRTYFFAFLIPAALLFISYAIFGVYPFGKESVLVLDLNGQYVYYFENLRDALHGSGSLLNSWSRNFSGEIIGMFAYYLASPFTLIVMLLPRSFITGSLLIMQLCKVGTAGVTMCHYLRRCKKLSASTSLIFCIIYALMAYVIVQLMNPMWLDGLIYLPLICKGIEKLIDEKKKWLYFIIPLSLMFMANFYIGWMIAIFCILYFIAYYFFRSEQTMPFKFSNFFVKGLKFAFGGITAAACAAWLIVPLYYSLKLGKFEFTNPDYSMKTQFDFLDFFKNMLPNVYDTCRPEGSPVMYCGVLTIILVPLYFMNKRVSLRNKIGGGMLALSIILSMYMSTVDIVWHGLQVPNWLPYRYSFTCCFVLIIMAAQAFEHIDGISYKEIGAVFFMLCAYVLYVDKQKLEHVTLLATIWFTVASVGIYSLLLYLYKKFYHIKPVPVAVVIMLAVELVITSTYTMYRIDQDVVYSTHASYNRYITLGRNTISKLKNIDSSLFYRVESNYHRTVNDALAFGSYGISHSSSTLNSAPIEFMRKLGFSYGGHYIKYKGSTYVTDSLFDIKYVIEKGSAVPDAEGKITPALSKHYDKCVLANGDNTDIFYVYENPYALPVAFMADKSIADLDLSGTNPFENQNDLLSALVSDEHTDYFNRVEVDDIVTENAKQTSYGSHSKYVPRVEGENSHIEFLLTAPTSDMMYVYFPSSYERKVNLWLNHDFLDYYFEGGNKVIQTLGRFEQGEEISLITTITEEKNEVLFADEYFYYLDEEKFHEAVDTLRQHPLELEEFSESHLKGSVTAEKDGILFTTISWEPGWTIKVDGVETEPVEIADALIGIPVSAGTHTVEMSFFPYGMVTGILATMAGVVVLIIIAVYERRRKNDKLSKITG